MSKTKKVVVVDGQIFQTGAWHRGMGKYMLQLMKQISEQAPDTIELKVLFNKTMEIDDARLETIRYLSPNFEHLFAELPVPKNKSTDKDQYRQALDDFLRSVVDSKKELTYIITTLFSFDIYAEYPTMADRKAMIFYDLIPLLNWKDLGGYFPPDLYMSRFAQIYESDVLYCISETTRQDVMTTFAVAPEKAVNINGGFTEHHLKAVKPSGFTVPKRYILFPTGNLPHKNNELVFKAMREVVKQDPDVHLLVTSSFSDAAMTKLRRICKSNVLFTQNVTDEELQYLYKNASLILFASKYEGLGLPVLDAVFHNKPIAASGISVFKEMTEDAFFFFEPSDVNSAAETIVKALKRRNFAQKKQHYPDILNKYDWKHVGAEVIKHLYDTVENRTKRNEDRPKIAIVSLNPGIANTIGRQAERLYPALKDIADVSYFFDSAGLHYKKLERPTFLDYVGKESVFDLSRLTIRMYGRFDKVIYLMDSHSLDTMMMEYAAVLPGYILYDKTMPMTPVCEAAFQSARSTHAWSTGTSADEAVAFIMEKAAEPNAIMKILHSHLPLRLKRAYLKREMENETYAKKS